MNNLERSSKTPSTAGLIHRRNRTGSASRAQSRLNLFIDMYRTKVHLNQQPQGHIIH